MIESERANEVNAEKDGSPKLVLTDTKVVARMEVAGELIHDACYARGGGCGGGDGGVWWRWRGVVVVCGFTLM